MICEKIVQEIGPFKKVNITNETNNFQIKI